MVMALRVVLDTQGVFDALELRRRARAPQVFLAVDEGLGEERRIVLCDCRDAWTSVAQRAWP